MDTALSTPVVDSGARVKPRFQAQSQAQAANAAHARAGQPLSDLHPGAVATIVAVGSASATFTPLELRLLELGFIAGERIEIVAEARPGGDPFVVRVGSTQFALRRREARNIWVEDAAASP